jgi:hypothetical protein
MFPVARQPPQKTRLRRTPYLDGARSARGWSINHPLTRRRYAGPVEATLSQGVSRQPPGRIRIPPAADAFHILRSGVTDGAGMGAPTGFRQPRSQGSHAARRPLRRIHAARCRCRRRRARHQAGQPPGAPSPPAAAAIRFAGFSPHSGTTSAAATSPHGGAASDGSGANMPSGIRFFHRRAAFFPSFEQLRAFRRVRISFLQHCRGRNAGNTFPSYRRSLGFASGFLT